MTMINTLNLSI